MLISRIVGKDETMEPLTGLRLHRSTSPGEPLHSVCDPVFCVIAQGSKEVLLNNERYQYDPSHYLLVTAELPVVGHVLAASKQNPYLSLRLDLDPALVGSVMVEAGHAAAPDHNNTRAIDVGLLDAGLLDAVVRLLGLQTPLTKRLSSRR